MIYDRKRRQELAHRYNLRELTRLEAEELRRYLRHEIEVLRRMPDQHEALADVILFDAALHARILLSEEASA